MFLTILAAVGVIFVIFLTLRYRTKMAALVAWIVGTLIADKNKEEVSVATKSTNRKVKNKKTKKVKEAAFKAEPLKSTVKEIPVEEASTSKKETSELSTATKYQAVSVQETRRQSLDFETLVNKLEKIQENPEISEEPIVSGNKSVTSEIKVGNQDNENQNLKKSVTVKNTQRNSKKKRSPKTEGKKRGIDEQVDLDIKAQTVPDTAQVLQEAKEKLLTSKKIHLEYQQSEVVPKNTSSQQEKEIVENKASAEKSHLDSLPKSSIIEHYKTKSKRFVASNKTISTSQETQKRVITKIEVNIKTSNIIEEPSKLISEEQTVNTQTEQKQSLKNQVSSLQTKSAVTKSSNINQEQPKLIVEEHHTEAAQIEKEQHFKKQVPSLPNKSAVTKTTKIIEEQPKLIFEEQLPVNTQTVQKPSLEKQAPSIPINVAVTKTSNLNQEQLKLISEKQHTETTKIEKEQSLKKQVPSLPNKSTITTVPNITEEQSKLISEEQHAVNTQTESEQSLKKQTPSLTYKTTITKAPTMKTITQVRVLTLNDNEHQDSTIYRIEKNWTLQFRLGPSLLGRKVSLYCNYPENKDGKIVQFNRNRYFLLPWSQDEGCHHADDTALFTQITVTTAGSFHYYFIYENATESGPHGSGFFLVDPILKYGNKEELPLNCIQCQTVLSKCLGPLSTWENKLRVAKESGYNVIHFTPIQELGVSNSAYSLSGQLKLNPSFNDNNTKTTFADIEKFTSKMRTEWKVLSICDIVLNHTANETDWLPEHPEGTYNCLNCPYMRPAYLLDAALHQFSVDVKNGFFETMGIPPVVCTEDHLNAIRHALQTKVLAEINLAEMFICNVNKLTSEFLDRARKVRPNSTNENLEKKLKLIQHPMYERLASTIDMDLALKIYNVYRADSFDEDSRLRHCGEEFKHTLDELNKKVVDELDIHLDAAVKNCIAGIRYFRVQHDGPKIKEISENNPLCFRYFTDYGKPKTIEEYEKILYGPNSKHLMAHNGWVMNADPMKNFADSDSNVYIRRELIAWGDSVKLRFGDKPEDCPFLWNHMKTYVEQTAKIFDGVRLDNCHSTPIPVAEYLLDCARIVRPDLYVVAELFTNSDSTDNIFVNRLGITSLIREAMSAWDSHEEGRLVYRYGGDPVGAFFQPHFRPLVPSIAHALFLDLTHDNPSPVDKRSVFDLLPSAALVNMACCASGSNRGYDELVNHHIHVVDETRNYTEWTNDESLASENARYVSYKSGIISAKRAINDLHFKLGIDGFNQVYVDQMDPDIVAVTRHRPETHQSVILVAFTAFGHPSVDAANYQRGIKPLRVEGVLDEIILEATLNHKGVEKGGSKYAHPEDFAKDAKWINGLSEYQVDIKQHIQLVNSDVFELADSGNPNIIQLNFKNFKPGSIVAIKVSLPKNVQTSISKLRDLMLSFSRRENTDLADVIGRLNLADLNRALYRCDQEERDEGKGFGTYNIPNFGSLVYCGLQGFMSLLSTIRPSNDLGHPMCGNLRDGNWMIDYICQRLKLDDGTKELGQWIEKNTQPFKDIPRYLVPSYFDVIVTGIYINLLEQSYNLMSDFVKTGSTFVKGLSLGSLQFAAVIKSAVLPTLSPTLAPPKPPMKQNDEGKLVQACVTLSAGLPHFSTGYMRNWGRDTFIALRGLFILTGRFEDARYHILGYAACLRHALIPNLLDGGRNSRFNCRDAVWWWLYCIKSYVEEAPNGANILLDKVSRIFPTDDSPAIEPGVEDQALYEVIQESLKIHFQGLIFRERNAGRQIDAHMSDRGFNNQIGIHPETGFVFGGNEANCGTWMDKMGSSDNAGNRGKPATPRDGSAVELVGLSKAVVTWLSELYQQKLYPYQGVERTSKSGTMIKWTFKQWAGKIQKSFEQYFWVNTVHQEGEIRPDLINKRGIYKDCHGATQAWTDFQLRCNFPIAMVAAPELFNPKHAWVALQNVEKYLLGPLGMKTLDPDDWAYCGDYNNADDSSNFKTANGFNYHQGPEWLWPVGYYLRAKLHFAAENGDLARTLANTKVVLAKHFTELQTSVWRGLPELTNSNGSYCYDSSRTQAWSMSCILEVLHDLQKIEAKQQPAALN